MIKHKTLYRIILTLILTPILYIGCKDNNDCSRFGTGLHQPSIRTIEPSNICATTAISGCHLTPKSIYLGYEICNDADIVAKGVCWSTSPNPTIENDTTTQNYPYGGDIYNSYITGLTPKTTYYVRAFAITEIGTIYGEEYSFTTHDFSGTITDVDGNIYHFITIGAQQWLVENLKTTRFNDSTPIPTETDNLKWIDLNAPAYCWYNNDETTYKERYGALYNYYAISTNKLTPKGWHSPSKFDWTRLQEYVSNNAGISLTVAKALANTADWYISTNTGAIGNNLDINNGTGFTALPGGWRDYMFKDNGNMGLWWSSLNRYDNTYGTGMILYSNENNIYEWTTVKSVGLSVRCIRD